MAEFIRIARSSSVLSMTQYEYFVLQTLLLVDVERRFIDCSSVRIKVVIANSTQHQSSFRSAAAFLLHVVKFHWSYFPWLSSYQSGEIIEPRRGSAKLLATTENLQQR